MRSITCAFVFFTVLGSFQSAFAQDMSVEARNAFNKFGPSRNKKSLNDPGGMLKFGNQYKKVLQVVRVSVHDKADYHLLAFCSGTLISENQVLTAKKCLDVGDKEVHIFTTTDFHKKGDAFNHPDAPTWSDVESVVSNNDVAVLNLKKSIGHEAGTFMIHSSTDALPNLGISLAGFPLNANALNLFAVPVKHIIHDCETTWSSVTGLIYSNCHTAPGLIGGPLYYTKDGKQYLVGVMLEQFSLDATAEVSVSKSFFSDDLAKLLGK